MENSRSESTDATRTRPTDSDFESFNPLLYGALGRLARQGYSVPPHDGMDLVHDFFVEAWPSVRSGYQPAKASFTTYLFGAFVQFARPRIIRLKKWQLQLVVDEPSPAFFDPLEHEHAADIDLVQKALSKLSTSDRELLLLRFCYGTTERELARQEHTSRYRVRERTVAALATLSAGIDDGALLDSEDRAIAMAVFGDGRTDDDIAAELNLTRAQVGARKRRMLGVVAKALPRSTRERGPEMKQMEYCHMWSRIVKGQLAENDRQLNWEQILDHIEDCAQCSEQVPNPEVAAKLYTSLFGSTSEDPSGEVQDELLRLSASIDIDTGRAVQELLLPSLPTNLQQRAARWSPVTLFRAIDAVAMTVERHTRGSEHRHALLSKSALELSNELVPASELKREICILAKVEQTEAAQMLQWIAEAGRSHSRLFPGIRSLPHDGGRVRLEVHERPEDLDLDVQWAPEPAEYQVPLHA